MINSDTPTTAADQFGRTGFARQLAACLQLAPGQDSLVVGLEGEWGGGKSWVIEQVKAVLAEQDAIVINFNPWLINAEQELIGSFLQEMAAQVMEHAGLMARAPQLARSLAGKIGQYGAKLTYLKYLKYLPVVGGAAELVGDVAAEVAGFVTEHEERIKAGAAALSEAGKVPEASLQARRKQVEQALLELKVPLVVVIDDLDRLRAREIQIMIQLVKAVANFKGVAFLLAYDAKYVSQAISHDGTQASGSAYLEKIVQLACQLPPLVPWVYRDWLRSQVGQVTHVAQLGRELRPFEAQRLTDVTKLVARLLRHPRDVVRWLNRLRFAHAGLGAAIDFGDLMLVEALQIVSPESVRALVKQPALLFPKYEKHFASKYQVGAAPVDPQAWLEQVAANEDIVRSLVALFPHLAHPSIAFMRDDEAHSHGRVAVYEHWLHYLNRAQVEGQRDAALVLEVLKNPEEYALLPERFDGVDEFGEFCHSIVDYLTSDKVADPMALLDSFCRTAAANWQANVTPDIRLVANTCLLRLVALLPEPERESGQILIGETVPLSLFGAFAAGKRQMQNRWVQRFLAMEGWQDRDDTLAVLGYLGQSAVGIGSEPRPGEHLTQLVEQKHLPTLVLMEYLLERNANPPWVTWSGVAWEKMIDVVTNYTSGQHLNGRLLRFIQQKTGQSHPS
jgi:hypothetical protein